MHLKSLIAVVVRMFASHHLDKPTTEITAEDINSFLNGLNEYGRKADVVRQIQLVLFGKFLVRGRVTDFMKNLMCKKREKKSELILILYGGTRSALEMKMTNYNYRDFPDYNFTFKDWRIGDNYPIFQPHECVINEIMYIYEHYKFPKNPATIVIKEHPDQLTQSKCELDEQIENLPDTKVRRLEIPEEPLSEDCRNQEWKNPATIVVKEHPDQLTRSKRELDEQIENLPDTKVRRLEIPEEPLYEDCGNQERKNPATIVVKERPDQLTQSKRELDEQIENLPDTKVRRLEIPEEPLYEDCCNQEWKAQPMDMVPNSQPLQQLPQQLSSTPLQIPEASRSVQNESLTIFDSTTASSVQIKNEGGTTFQNVSQPQVNKLASESTLAFANVIEYHRAQKIKKSVQTILNEISPESMLSLTESLKMLPIGNIQCLEIAVNLVFEKAIEKQCFAPLCSILCSAMKSVKVISNNGKQVTFQDLILSKCQSLLEINETREMEYAKRLTDIKDLEKKKELQLEFEKNEKILLKRSVKNCRFMGELFKQKILTPSIMMYHIMNLINKHGKEPLECLCILLKTVGKELEESYNLNDTFDKLEALTSNEMKSKIPSRITSMIQDVINLRREKWIPRHVDSNPKLTNEIKDEANEEQFTLLAKNTPEKQDHLHTDVTLSPIDTVEQSESLNSIAVYKVNMKCKNILLEYEQLQNLNDIIYSLSEDDSSVIFKRYEEFVKNMSLITLDSPITRTSVAGTIFAELLSKNILSMTTITQGIDDVLKCWNDFLMDFPQFFTYIAAIIAPLLLSQNCSFDFNSLKDSCTSIRPDNSSKLFIEVLYKINSSKEVLNIKEELGGGILWIYNKWNALENVPLDVFVPNNQINNYFKKDQIGVFILSIAIYDKMKSIDKQLLYNILKSWICTNINAEIIKTPLFVQALTIAIVVVCLKLNHSYEDFFDSIHLKLLTYYIKFGSLPEHEIKAREVQCMFGIQIMSATLKHPGGMVLKLFNKLYLHRVIRKESFELFIQEYEKIADK